MVEMTWSRSNSKSVFSFLCNLLYQTHSLFSRYGRLRLHGNPVRTWRHASVFWLFHEATKSSVVVLFKIVWVVVIIIKDGIINKILIPRPHVTLVHIIWLLHNFLLCSRQHWEFLSENEMICCIRDKLGFGLIISNLMFFLKNLEDISAFTGATCSPASDLSSKFNPEDFMLWTQKPKNWLKVKLESKTFKVCSTGNITLSRPLCLIRRRFSRNHRQPRILLKPYELESFLVQRGHAF